MRDRLCAANAGLDHKLVLGLADAQDKFPNQALGGRKARLTCWLHSAGITDAGLYDSKLMDVARKRSLSHLLPLTSESPPQVLLVRDISVFDKLQYQLLPRKLGHGA